ncbi:hypothetical protein [Aggregatibacter kilianii]|uniref:hypothetical protein n=1 Tax=Aggregatibacter kilianii TaxID=2025884 RepID=UPI000D640F7D|nr:hypothetical protein [Aggregatibacter kilianii]
MTQYNLKDLKVGDILDLEHATFVVDGLDSNDDVRPICLSLTLIKSSKYTPLTADTEQHCVFDSIGTEWWVNVDFLGNFNITDADADTEDVPTTYYSLDTLKVGDTVKTEHAEFTVEYVGYNTETPLCLRLESILSCKYKPLDAAANTHKAGLWLFDTVGNSYYVSREALPDFGINVDRDIDLNNLPKPFWPKHDDTYYSITLTGVTGSVARFTDASVITKGNCFRTEEDAQAWLNAMRSRRGPRKG